MLRNIGFLLTLLLLGCAQGAIRPSDSDESHGYRVVYVLLFSDAVESLKAARARPSDLAGSEAYCVADITEEAFNTFNLLAKSGPTEVGANTNTIYEEIAVRVQSAGRPHVVFSATRRAIDADGIVHRITSSTYLSVMRRAFELVEGPDCLAVVPRS